MGSQTYKAIDIKGLTPAIDPTRSDDMFVLNGKNYLFDALGPRSGFGSRFLLPHRLLNPVGVQGQQLDLQIGRRNFTITNQSIQIWDEELGGWRFIYVFPVSLVVDYRWSTAYVNGRVGFCHPDVGILTYDVDNDVCERLADLTVGSPDRPIAICDNNGRLVAVGPDYWHCGNPSDMLDWEIKLGGAVLQKVNDRVPGYPVMITSFANGTMVWTTGGVMRSEFTGDAAVYRHRAVQTKYRPVNSYCVVQLNDETVVVLDERGLFQTKGDSLEPYAPVFNEFLNAYIKNNDLDLTQALRLEWNPTAKLLYLSVKLAYGTALYEKCYVHYPAIDKWGSFDSPHFGILPIWIDKGPRRDDYFGFVDAAGRFNYWLRSTDCEVLPVDATLDLYYPLVQKPLGSDYDSTGRISSASGIIMSGYEMFPDITVPLGFRILLDTTGDILTEGGLVLIEPIP